MHTSTSHAVYTFTKLHAFTVTYNIIPRKNFLPKILEYILHNTNTNDKNRNTFAWFSNYPKKKKRKKSTIRTNTMRMIRESWRIINARQQHHKCKPLTSPPHKIPNPPFSTRCLTKSFPSSQPAQSILPLKVILGVSTGRVWYGGHVWFARYTDYSVIVRIWICSIEALSSASFQNLADEIRVDLCHFLELRPPPPSQRRQRIKK